MLISAPVGVGGAPSPIAIGFTMENGFQSELGYFYNITWGNSFRFFGGALELTGVYGTLKIASFNRIFKAAGKIDDVALSNFKHISKETTDISVDCSDIASDLYKLSDETGDVIEYTTKSGDDILLPEKTGKVENYTYHQVYTKDGYVYDPYYSDTPTLMDDYMKMLKESNKGQIIDVSIETP